LRIGSIMLTVYASAGIAVARAQEGPHGITVPLTLPAFNPNAAACTPPPGLKKLLAFAQDNEREFIVGVSRGLAAAAKDRGLTYRVALAGNDGAKMIEQVEALVTEKAGAVVAAPVDPASLSGSLQKFMGRAASSAPSFRRRRR